MRLLYLRLLSYVLLPLAAAPLIPLFFLLLATCSRDAGCCVLLRERVSELRLACSCYPFSGPLCLLSAAVPLARSPLLASCICSLTHT